MSLVCHRIVSTYAPNGGETVEEEVEQDDVWEKEHFTGNGRRLHSKPAPTFIPAALKYDEFGMPKIEKELRALQDPRIMEDVASWYRNLTAKTESSTRLCAAKTNGIITKSVTSTSTPNSNSSQSASENNSPRPDWFGPRPLNEPVNVNSTVCTLADLLSRNPPPLPSEPAFTPPTFLALGPSNKGFAMLQKKGWKEGEGLGNFRRVGLGMKVKQELEPQIVDLTQSDGEEPIIDLTGSASEIEDEADELLSDQKREVKSGPGSISAECAYESPTHGGTALITPLGTVLKADRLGIGLKARRTKKTVTHSPAEIAAYIRTKKQLEKQKWGRGSKALARKSRQEALKRAQMLKYLNE